MHSFLSMTIIDVMRALQKCRQSIAGMRAYGNKVVSYLSPFRLPLRSNSVDLVIGSDLFDLDFYNRQLAHPLHSVEQGAMHYLSEGAKLGLNPNSLFDTNWYRLTHNTGNAQECNPLVDFIGGGPPFKQNPSLKFDCGSYLKSYPDVQSNGMNPLTHYFRYGHREGRLPPAATLDGQHLTHFLSGSDSAVIPYEDRYFRFCLPFVPMPSYLREHDMIPEMFRSQRVFDSSFPESKPEIPYIAMLENTRFISGSRFLISEDNTLISDEYAEFWQVPDWSGRFLYSEISQDGKVALIVRRGNPYVLSNGMHLMHEYASNYFHALVELIPRLIIMESAGIDVSVPLLLQEELHENITFAISIFKNPDRKIVLLKNNSLFECEKLVFSSDVSSVQDVYKRARLPTETRIDVNTLYFVRETVIARILPSHSCDEGSRALIYVKRGTRARGIKNESEIESALRPLGFACISVEMLSFEQQVHLFNNASIIVAPTGASLTNMLWCKEGTKVCVLAAEHVAMPLEIWHQLGDIAGCDTSICLGQHGDADQNPTIHSSYSIEIDRLKGIVQALLP